MWKWIKNLFKPEKQDPHIEMYERNEYTVEQLEKMTKGDRKKLKEQGKINSIAHPFYQCYLKYNGNRRAFNKKTGQKKNRFS